MKHVLSVLAAVSGWVLLSANAFLGAAPANDNFAIRIPLRGLIVNTVGDNLGATRETGEPTHWLATARPASVWWSWTAPASGLVAINTTNSWRYINGAPSSTALDSVLAVYTGSVVSNLSLVASNDDSVGAWSGVEFSAVAGTAYQIAVAGYSAGYTGSVCLAINGPVLSGSTNVLLVQTGSVWRYLDDGSDGGTAWLQPGFGDAGWASGPAPLGYGDANGVWPATTNGYGPDLNNKYPTTYYRRAFVISNSPTWSTASLRVQRDDGLVVYLNGTEVYRNGMAAGTPGYRTYATNTVAGADELAWYGTNFDPALLVAGTNVVAVEVHQVVANSSDVFFDLELSGVALLGGWPQAPIVSLTAPADGAVLAPGTNVTVTAEAYDNDGAITNVVFYRNEYRIGADGVHPYGLVWSNLPAGAWALRAVATDNSGLTTTSAVANILVASGPLATVTITNPPEGATYIAPATFTIQAAVLAGTSAVQKVSFYANTTLVGEDPSEPYAVSWQQVGVGSYPLRAVVTLAGGGSVTSAVVNVSVVPNQVPLVSLTNPVNSASFTAPASLLLGATASDADGTVTNVEFYANGLLLGRTGVGPYTWWWSSIGVGSYQLRAVAEDNLGARGTSAPVQISVTAPQAAGGLAFNGTSQYVTFGTATNLDSATFTLEVWFNWTGGGATASTGSGGVSAIPLIAKCRGEADGNTQDGNYFLGIRPADGMLAADFEEGATGSQPGLNHPVVGVTPVTPGVWHHAAVTFDGTNWRLYLDGRLDATSVVGQPPRWDSIQQAALATALDSTGVPQGYFAGTLDEARIWNYARSALQITNNLSLQIATAAGLIGRWSLDETNGVTAHDSSGNGADGTLVNGPVWTNGYPAFQSSAVQWVAYNDHVRGSATAANATAYTVSSSGAAVGGPLIDFGTGAPVSASPAGVEIAGTGTIVGVSGGSAAPDLGSPADQIFAGIVDWTGSALYFAPTPYTAAVTITFTNLTPGRVYRFRGSAVRGNNYAGRWTLATLAGAAAATPAHLVGTGSPGIVTNGWSPYGDALAPLTQAAWDSGENRYGDVIGWDNIIPIGNSFAVISSNFHAVATAGPLGTLEDTYAYAINAFRLEEISAPGTMITLISPTNLARLAGPTNVTVTASASGPHAITNVAFLAQGVLIGEVISSPYSLVWSNVLPGAYSLQAVAYDIAGGQATSAVVQITVVSAPPTVAITQPARNAEFELPTNITLAATASGVAAVTNVAFYAGGTLLGQAVAQPFSLVWSNPAVGVFGLLAVGTDSYGTRGTSSVVMITVHPPPTNTVPPVVASVLPAAGPVSNVLTSVTVVFSKVVTNVDAADLLLNGVPATGVQGGGTTFTFSVGQPAYGPVAVTWAANHGITDLGWPILAFNAGAAGSSWQYQFIDTLPPVVVGLNPAASATVRLLDQIAVTFNEPVTGVRPEALQANGAPANGVVGSGAGPYTFQFNRLPEGAVDVAWAPGQTITDTATPPNAFAGGGWSYTVNSNAVVAGSVVLTEIMYHPGSENDREEYVELYNTTGDSLNLAGWHFGRGLSFTFSNLLLAPRAYLVVAADETAFRAKYPTVTNVVGNWVGRLSNRDEEIELEDAEHQRVDLVHYADEGDWAIRQRGRLDNGAYGWEWYAEHDGFSINTATGRAYGSKSLEMLNPALPGNNGQNWTASLVTNGTPGRANSVLTNNIAPLILEVAHFPPVPKPTEPVAVTARVVDETNEVTAVLYYRSHSSTAPPSFSTTNMLDDGLHGDGAAGDGVYGAIVPPFANGTVIEFYVQATDRSGLSRTWPAPARQLNGSFAQTANALYQVDESLAPASPANLSQPFYRLILTESERTEFAGINSSSDAEMNCTFLTQDGSGTRVRYLCGVRIRGAGTRGRAVKNLRVNVPTDRRWDNANELNLNTQFVHAQLTGSALAAKLGLPAAEARVVQVRINGANLASSLPADVHWSQNSQGDGFGSYIYVESMNADWAQRLMPGNAGGNCYRASIYPWIANLKFLDTTNPSTWVANGYYKASNQSENDYSDLRELTRALSAGLPEAEYVEAVRTNVNVELFARYFVVCNMMDYMETALCRGVGDDYAMYRGSTDRRFMINAHDFDTILGQGDTGGSSTRSIWSFIDSPASTASDQQAVFLIRLLRHPAFAPIYFREYKQALETAFTRPEFDALLDQVLGGWVPASTVTSMKNFMVNRRTSLLAQLPLAYAVHVPLSLSGPYYRSTSPTVVLDGDANAVETQTVLVNGQVADFTVWQGHWTNTVSLIPGLNAVVVQCLATNGTELYRRTLDIWYDNAGGTPVSEGTLAASTTWLADLGPYRLTNLLLIPAGVTLTIEPGTSVYFGAGAGLIATNGGRLLAEGTDTRRLRFTRPPGTATNWSGITVYGGGGSSETRISYAQFEFHGTTAIRSSGGTVFLDHLTFGTTDYPYLSLDNSSFVVRDCHFPSPTASFEPVHGSGGIKSGGRGLFQRNFFGAVTGYNGVIDFTGGNRPGSPIVQFINNVFAGSDDDILDLDGTDAWVEGNIFMHVHKNNSPDTASAVSGGSDSGQTSEVTLLGNIICDCDQAVMAKQGNFYTLLNNTIVHQTKAGGTDTAAAVVCLADEGTSEGAGLYLEGNIICDAEQLVRNRTNAWVTFTNNFMTLPWTGPGGGNSAADPLFLHVPVLSETTNLTNWAQAQVWRQWLSLRAGSPAAGAGPNGRDAGDVIARGASVAGEPDSLTRLTTATLTVGVGRAGNGIPVAGWPAGSGYTHYKWRLDFGTWSAETPLGTPITLSGLGNGPHRVEVSGKNDAGWYQDDPLYGPDASVTVSRTWIVSPSAPGLRLNEVLAANRQAFVWHDTTPDCLELYNAGPTNLDLYGVRLTDDPQTPDKFKFPYGTSLAAGGYLVVLANNSTATPGLHLGFNLNRDGETLYLLESVARGGALLDSVTFGRQVDDFSIGRLADGNWGLTRPTLGSANAPAALGDPHGLKLNEWLAFATALPDLDFVELYNPAPWPVSLGGLFLTDSPEFWPDRHAIAALNFIPANGFYAFWADANPSGGPDHLNFSLRAEEGLLGLFDANLAPIDLVYYEPQLAGQSQGRMPNGAPATVRFATPTPDSPNPAQFPGSTNIVTTEIVLLPPIAPWRYNQTDDLTATEWYLAGYDDSTWATGLGMFAFDWNNSTLVGLTNTGLADPRTAAPGLTVPRVYFFRTWFNVTNDLSGATVNAIVRVDDGAVLYVNGQELPRLRLGIGQYNYASLATATPSGGDTVADEVIPVPASYLVPGSNLIAAVVFQNSSGSSDAVLGVGLTATKYTTNISGGGVVLNEVLARNSFYREADGSTPDWVELYNPSLVTADLSNYSLTDATASPRRWVFPPGVTVGPYGYLRLLCDGGKPPSTNRGGLLNTGFGLKETGGGLYLYDQNVSGVSSVLFGLQTPDYSIARYPDGSGDWTLCTPTPEEANLPVTLGSPAALRINEWMANPSSGEDWFEVYNAGSQPVALGGLYLTDDLNNRQNHRITALSFLGSFTNAFQRFWADDQTAAGADHLKFKLKDSGEQLGLFSESGVLLDGLVFAAQQKGVSEGRFPDGGATVLRFPGTDSAGESNYRLLTNVVINEVLTHTDPPLEDAIELFNPTAQAVDLGGWWLSDSKGALMKYRIPDGTVVPAYGFRVFYESNSFNSGEDAALRFALSSGGDQVYLSAATSNGLTGFRTGVQFGAAQNGVSFGRYLTSESREEFVPLSRRTFGVDDPSSNEQFRQGTGATNAYPRVEAVVISEMMYHPPNLGTNDNVRDEFIELHNRSALPVPLYDPAHPANTWHLRQAISFDFPTNLVLPAFGYLVVVSFNPEADPDALAAFQAAYGLTNGVTILGPYDGKLANDNNHLELNRPDSPDSNGVPRLLVDEVHYRDQAPWPVGADGLGASLNRLSLSGFGNDPTNWVDGPPSPGGLSLPSITTQPASQTVDPGTNVTFTVGAWGVPPLTYQWRHNGLELAGATSPFLTLATVTLAEAGRYDVQVRNPYGVVLSLPALLTVRGGGTDSDGDGMPDEWESRYGLNPTDPADAAQDPDGDGLTNLQEFRAGTDPREAASTLRLFNLGFRPGAGYVFGFPSVSNQTYSVLASPVLGGGTLWTNLFNLPAQTQSGWREVVDPTAGPSLLRFYRLETPARP